MGAPTVPSTIGASEDWGASRDWGTEAAAPASKDWADTKDWAAEPSTKDWGADDLQPSGDWGTSVTMQDGKSAGAEWA